MISRKWLLACAVLLAVSFLLKLVYFTDPFFGLHISRQLQNMSVIESFMVDGIHPLKARTNYAGWPGYWLVEFPLYQMITAWVSQWTGNPLVTARALNLVFAAISIYFVFWIARTWFNDTIALYSALFFAWAPTNLVFHRSSMFDVLVVFFALAAQVSLMKWIETRNWKSCFLFLASGCCCVIIKPPYLLPCILVFIVYFSLSVWPPSFSSLYNALKGYKIILISFFFMAGALAVWMSIVQHYSIHKGFLNHLSWEALAKPKYYVVLLGRFIEQHTNPLNAVLFFAGTVWLWQHHRKDIRIVLLIIPIVYYLSFPTVNAPHAYYSLILIPYFSIVVGCGAWWLEQKIRARGSVKNETVQIAVCLSSVMISLLMFFIMIIPSVKMSMHRYQDVYREGKTILEPFQYGILYINDEGDFQDWEYLVSQPFKYWMNTFGKNVSINRTHPVPENLSDTPVVSSAMMYSLKLYGRIKYINDHYQIPLEKDNEKFRGHLRYVVFYLFKQKEYVYAQMRPHSPVYESSGWVVYDLKQKDQQ